MLGSTVLEVAIGLVFVFLLLSLLCTTVNEWIAGALSLRAKTLEEGIRHLLDSEKGDPKSLVEEFYKHPMIGALTRDKRRPSYIAPKTFAVALTDVLKLNRAGARTVASMAEDLGKIPQENVKKSLLAIAGASTGENKMESVQRGIEAWYDETMDRVGGWYKRKLQKITIGVAVVVVLFANADTLQLLTRLWTNPALRTAVVEQAKVRERTGPNWEYTDPESPIPTAPVDKAAGEKKTTSASALTEEERELLGQLVGWPADFQTLRALCEKAEKENTSHAGAFFAWIGGLIPAHFFGWLLSVIAVSFGAPFWFDALQKLLKLNLRMAGRSPSEKQPQAA